MKNRGITLIALVITIVVLLILAGVSISMLTGENGIIKQATEADILTELANVKEALGMYKSKDVINGVLTDEDLVEEGLLKEVLIKDTYRTLGIVTNLKTIDVQGKLGKSGEKQEETEVETIQDLYDIYGIDMEDGTLYYIRDGIWSIDGTKVKYTAETGEEKEGYAVETLNQAYLEKSKFITEWTVDAGTTITLPITEEPNITIEWGDGATEECTIIQPTHTYTDAGTYEIKIAGNMSQWEFSTINTSKDYITGLKQWGMLGIKHIDFNDCTNLTGTIPSHKLKGEFEKLDAAHSLFSRCSKLSGTIPKDLFEDAKEIRHFTGAFRECSGLTGKIPEDLFKDCVNTTSFREIFQYCSGLTGTIPENLFAKNVKVQNFELAFQNCTGLIGTIPADLFKNNTEITSVNRVFENCNGFTGKLPDGLFKNCSKITNLSLSFRNTSITEIPVDIFDINNGETNGILDLAGVFEGTKITTIPTGLFDLCTEVTNFGNEWAYSGIFQNCKLLETIPDKLFYNNTKAIRFGNAFNGCINLKEIPENIFNTSQGNVSMWYAFNDCKSLTKIPGGIFKNVPNITNLNATFRRCTNLVEIGDEFSINNDMVNMSNTFAGNEKLSKFPSKLVIPTSVTEMSNMFSGCKQLITVIVLKTNSVDYRWAFDKINKSTRINWAAPCTEEYVDEILAVTGGSEIKGIEVTE